MNEEIKTKSRKKLIMIGALALFMILSISLTWAYWAGTINGTNTDRDLNVDIGSGGNINTQLTLTGDQGPQGLLVPYGLGANLQLGQVRSVSFTINASWAAAPGADPSNLVQGIASTVTANVAEIRVGATDLTDAMGWRNRVVENGVATFTEAAPLFEVEFAPPTQEIIGGGAAVPVEVTITMNFPYDRAMYVLVSDYSLVFTINLSVASV